MLVFLFKVVKLVAKVVVIGLVVLGLALVGYKLYGLAKTALTPAPAPSAEVPPAPAPAVADPIPAEVSAPAVPVVVIEADAICNLNGDLPAYCDSRAAVRKPGDVAKIVVRLFMLHV